MRKIIGWLMLVAAIGGGISFFAVVAGWLTAAAIIGGSIALAAWIVGGIYLVGGDG